MTAETFDGPATLYWITTPDSAACRRSAQIGTDSITLWNGKVVNGYNWGTYETYAVIRRYQRVEEPKR